MVYINGTILDYITQHIEYEKVNDKFSPTAKITSYAREHIYKPTHINFHILEKEIYTLNISSVLES